MPFAGSLERSSEEDGTLPTPIRCATAPLTLLGAIFG